MARNETTPLRKKAAGLDHAGSWRERWLARERVQATLRVLTRVGLVATLAAVTYGSLRIKADVESDPRFRLENWRLEFGAYPEWVSAGIREEVEAIRHNGVVGPGASGTLFETRVLASLRARLLENSWIAAVEDIGLSYPGVANNGEVIGGGLAVSLRLRRPVAVVQYGAHYYLTDYDGVRVGAARRHYDFDELRAPLVQGVQSASGAPAAGERWEVDAVLEGLSVARVLFARRINDRFADTPIVAIDAGNVGGRLQPDASEIVLTVQWIRRVPLAWGRSPISRGARIAPLDEVVGNLETVLERPRYYLGESRAAASVLRLDVPGHIVRVEAPSSSPEWSVNGADG